MGSRQDYARNGLIFAFLAQVWVCLIVNGGGVSSKMEMFFLYLVVATRLSCKTCVPSTQNNIYVGFGPQKENS